MTDISKFLNRGSGGGLLDLVSTGADEVNGKKLLKCNGRSFDASLYPDVQSLFTPINLVTERTNTTPSSGSHASSDISSDGTRVLQISSTPNSDPDTITINLYDDAFNISGPTLVDDFNFDFGGVINDRHTVSLNLDGTKGFALTRTSSNSQIRSYYIQNGNTIFQGSTTSLPFVFGDGITSDMNNDGSMGLFSVYRLTSSSAMYYSTNGGDDFTQISDNGLGLSTGHVVKSISSDKTGNGAYAVVYRSVDLHEIWFKADVTNTTNWVIVDTINNGSSSDRVQHKVSSNGQNHLIIIGGDYYISSDDLSTIDLITRSLETSNAFNLTVNVNATPVQTKTGDLFYNVITNWTDEGGEDRSSQILIYDDARNPNFVSELFENDLALFNFSQDGFVYASFVPTIVTYFDESTGKAMASQGPSAQGSTTQIAVIDCPLRTYTPDIEGAKVVVEQ